MTKKPKNISPHRTITPEDLLRFRVLSDAQIAPDGSRIVFVEKHVGQRNEYVSNLWMVEAEKGTTPFGAGLPTRPRQRSKRHGRETVPQRSLHRVRRGSADPAAAEKGTGPICAQHPSGGHQPKVGRGKLDLSPFPHPYQFTEGGKDHTPRWSPDGARIAFIRTVGGQAQICMIAAAGGEARKLTDFPEGSIGTFRWSPDGRCLAVSFCPEDPQWTEAAKKDRKEQGLSDPPRVIEGLTYRLDGEGYRGSRRQQLSMVAVESGRHRAVYDQDELGTFTFDFSPDGRQLVVSTNRDPEPTLHPWKDELLRIDVATGKIMRIPGLPPGPKTSVRWSPDGTTIAYAGRIGKDPLYGVENVELFVCDASDGTARKRGQSPLVRNTRRAGTNRRLVAANGDCPLFRSLTAAEDVCLQAEGLTDTAVGFGDPTLQFSPDGRRIYLRLSIGGQSHVASVAVRGGRLVFHTSGPFDVRMGNLSRDGRKMALTVGDATRLAEVAVLECGTGADDLFGAGLPTPPIVPAGDLRSRGGHGRETMPQPRETMRQPRCKPRMLTDLNGPLLAELQLSKPQSHWIRADDGHRVQVWVIKPPGRTGCQPVPDGLEIRSAKRDGLKTHPTNGRQKKLPAVLEIHGGPHAQYCSTFFHEFQVLAAAGYMVFYSNPRGSKGYGREHCAAIRGRWGTADWTDLQAVIRFMKDQPLVDSRRLGVIGGSYGGYMTNWVISHCRDFAAAVTDRSLSNLVSWSGNVDVIEPIDHYFPGNFWDQPEARWEQSPLRYLGNVKTPTLIVHSEGDLRCNIEQAEQLYAVLKLLGVPARFVRYPGSTSHGMSRSGPPDLRIHRLRQILGWWQEHLRPT